MKNRRAALAVGSAVRYSSGVTYNSVATIDGFTSGKVRMPGTWQNLMGLNSKPFTCGHCGQNLASRQGYATDVPGGTITRSYIYICHFCNKPTYFSSFTGGDQVPASAFGGSVRYIPSKEVESLYNEARNCIKVNANTAAVMCCRKLLMNVAVDQGADENRTFAYYVDYLADQGYLPPNGKRWAGHIRKKGNEATHEIPIMSADDAKELIEFSEMMLKFIYEYPARIEEKVQ